MQEYFEVGQIVNTHGLKGYVKVVPFTDDIQRFEELKSVFIAFKKELIECKIQDVKYVKNMVSLKFVGIDDINEAEKYKGCYLKISRKNAKKLDKNTYFIADLIGLKVYDEKEQLVGVLEDIFPTGSNDVYVVRTDEGKQILLPAISQVIKSVDIEQEKIIVDISQGVF